MSFLSASRTANVFGDGSAGSQNISGEINSYATVSSNISSGTSTIPVVDSSEFSVDETVMIHQTQRSDGNAGQYEFGIVTQIPSSSEIVLNEPTINTYQSNPSSANSLSGNATIAQIVGTPQYRNATLTDLVEARDWNGSTGGIVFLQVKDTLDANGNYISAFASGFRGGTRTNGNDSQSRGHAGESVNGLNQVNNDRNNITGGGGAPGTTDTGGDSGGSGGHAVAGRDGFDNGGGNTEGGDAIGDNSLTNIYFGGGGGRGGDNDSSELESYTDKNGNQISFPPSNPFPAFSSTINVNWNNFFGSGPMRGGQSGGIVVIFAENVTGLRANAESFPASGDIVGSGASHGAGGAGSIFMKVGDNQSFDDIVAAGTGFASNSSNDKELGGGSPGRVRIDIIGGTTVDTTNVDIQPFGALGSGSLETNTNVGDELNI
jgi:hypothetical protein